MRIACPTKTVATALLCLAVLGAPVLAQQQGQAAADKGKAASASVKLGSAMSMADPVGSFAPMLERVIPAVVTIRVTSETPAPVDFSAGVDEAGRGAPQKILARSGGSGVIVDPANGHILTNNHVIDGAVRIEVVLSDGRLLPAKLIGRDIGTDLAVVEVAARNLPAIAIGDSDKVRVGDVVAAVGNPFGLEGTATLGIVSALMRTEIGHEAFEDFLQIDAVINPGNSGGALVNVRGELIGINTATAGTSGNVGIGFTIPINMARTVKAELIKHGRMRRGSPGLVVEDLTYEKAASLMSGTNRGAIVTGVIAGSPAAVVGVAPGAIVTEVAGKPVRGAAEFNTRVLTVPLGTVLPIVVREGGRDRRLQLATAAVKLEPETYTLPAESGSIAGLGVTDIVLGNPHYGDLRGAQVASVPAEGRAARIGLKPGDVIVGVDGDNVRHAAHLFRFIGRAGMTYRLRIVRDGMPGWVRVER